MGPDRGHGKENKPTSIPNVPMIVFGNMSIPNVLMIVFGTWSKRAQNYKRNLEQCDI